MFKNQEDEWSSISEEAIDLIKNMLKMNPKERFNAEQALSHKWFKKFENSNPKTSITNTINNIRKFHVEF